MEFNKRLSRGGGVTLPAALRRQYGLAAGEKFAISVNPDGTILLKRTDGSCLFCQSEQQLIKHEGRYVCRSCIEAMSAEPVEGNAAE